MLIYTKFSKYLTNLKEDDVRPLTIILALTSTTLILIGCSQQTGQTIQGKNLFSEVARSAIFKSNGVFSQTDLCELVRNIAFQLNYNKEKMNNKKLSIKSTPHLFGEDIFIKFKNDSTWYSIKLHLIGNIKQPNDYLGYLILYVAGENFSLTILDDNFSGEINQAEYHFTYDKYNSTKFYKPEEKVGLKNRAFFTDSFGIHLYIINKLLLESSEIKFHQL